jgi:hypothetical protein
MRQPLRAYGAIYHLPEQVGELLEIYLDKWARRNSLKFTSNLDSKYNRDPKIHLLQ